MQQLFPKRLWEEHKCDKKRRIIRKTCENHPKISHLYIYIFIVDIYVENQMLSRQSQICIWWKSQYSAMKNLQIFGGQWFWTASCSWGSQVFWSISQPAQAMILLKIWLKNPALMQNRVGSGRKYVLVPSAW